MMISSLREKVKGPVAYLIIGLIIVPFALVGLDGYATKDGPGVYVGDEFVSSGEVQNELNLKLRKIPGSEDFTEDEKDEFYKIVEARLVMDAMLTHYSGEVGVSIGDKSISDYIRKQSYFKDENSVFNIDKYKTVLKNNRLTTTQYEGIVSEQLRKEKVAEILFLYAPKSFAIGSDLLNTRIKLGVNEIKLTEAERAGIEAPTQTDINDYYNINKALKYQTEIKKDVEYVLVGKDYIAGGIEPSENDLENRYNEYVARESRNIKYTFANKVFDNSEAANSYRFEETILDDLIMTDTNLADMGSDLAGVIPSMNVDEEKYIATEFGHMKIKLIYKSSPYIEDLESKRQSLKDDYLAEVYDLEFVKTIDELSAEAYEGSMDEIASKTSSELKKVNLIGNRVEAKINEKLLKEIQKATEGEISTVEVDGGVYVYKVVNYEPPFDKDIQLSEVMEDIKISLKEIYEVMYKVDKANNNFSGETSAMKMDISVSLFDKKNELERKILQKIQTTPQKRSGYVESNNSVYVYSIEKAYLADEKNFKDYAADFMRIQNTERTLRFESSFKDEFEFKIVN